jgi:protein-L-isoaspartate(D-aspartate) O-methyltransferase
VDVTREDETAATRTEMVQTLVTRHAVTSSSVEDAFLTVPRHLFVPHVSATQAYDPDVAIPTHFGPDGVSISSSSAPTIMARMLEGLRCRSGDHVLEIGTGTGYNAALLAHLVGPGGAVTSIELDEPITREAEAHLRVAGVAGVRTIVGDGWLGDGAGAPFDGLVVTVGVSDISPAWVEQLRPSGRLVVPLWLGPGFEVAVNFERHGDGLASVAVEWCGFMRLRGAHAGPETWEAVGPWTANVVGSRPGDVERLAALVGGPSRREPAPAFPAAWFAQLAMRERDAIQLVRNDGAMRVAWGLFTAGADPELDSLAVVEGSSLLVYGTDSARDRLLAVTSDYAPFSIAKMSIDALPIAAAPPSHSVVLCRRHHQFVLHGIT